MQRVTVAITASIGLISRHNVSDAHGRRVIAKGRLITAADVDVLRAHGITQVEVVQYDSDDIDEHSAAAMVASRCALTGVTMTPPHHGRVDIHATHDGVLRVDDAALAQWHTRRGVTIATHRGGSAVLAGQRVATIKIIPFALPRDFFVDTVRPVLRVMPYVVAHVAVIIVAERTVWERVQRTHLAALVHRLKSYPVSVLQVVHARPTVSAVTAQLCALTHADLVVTLTETSIMDLSDVVPASIEAAGGEITCYGAPVEPGNLLLLGEIGSTMVLGAPGCIRGLARNVVDLVLPRLFARLPTTATDIYAFANGGLLDTKERV